MKIGKSSIYFHLTAVNSHPHKSIASVPYWSLYSRPGDCIQDTDGKQWCSDRPLTFAELEQYLEQYPERRILDAYPRKSTAKRSTHYMSLIQDNNVHICNKSTKEIYATFAIHNDNLHNTYLRPNSPSPLSYYRKLADGAYFVHTWRIHCKANSKIKEE